MLPGSPAGRRDPRFRAGNLLTSARHASTIFVIDRDTDRIVWAWGPGEVLGQHMPTMLADGRVLLFDNGWETEEATRGHSRVIELDPLDGRIVWQYVADPPASFYSPTRGGSQRLANGNTLIAESNTGRLFEVTRGGEIVWEYWNPNRQDGKRPPIYRVVAYPPEVVEPLLKRS
jgi:outer membrane protein assembly factor BamB